MLGACNRSRLACARLSERYSDAHRLGYGLQALTPYGHARLVVILPAIPRAILVVCWTGEKCKTCSISQVFWTGEKSTTRSNSRLHAPSFVFLRTFDFSSSSRWAALRVVRLYRCCSAFVFPVPRSIRIVDLTARLLMDGPCDSPDHALRITLVSRILLIIPDCGYLKRGVFRVFLSEVLH